MAEHVVVHGAVHVADVAHQAASAAVVVVDSVAAAAVGSGAAGVVVVSGEVVVAAVAIRSCQPACSKQEIEVSIGYSGREPPNTRLSR